MNPKESASILLFPNVEIQVCPVQEHKPPCPRCGGGWPGTMFSSASIIRSIFNSILKHENPYITAKDNDVKGSLNPEKIGCLPLQLRVQAGMEFVRTILNDNENGSHNP